ncbi:prefoldin subunit 1-like isoform X1 [Gigantopelta aegis]|uniref:prefoldin subunit 1-like isoform X1 n=2 Tax=Gigantopelta aegis TaxID=1735272 RepID=UPI001B88B8A6|nr:prefoldin subunit 1-like isoform X1 [Gigantopelta aegis]
MSSNSSMPVDLELKKAFQGLQNKMVTTTQQLKISDAQVETLKRQMAHSKLVISEISQLPDDVRVFEGVGRMFLLQPNAEIKTNLDKKIKASDEKIKSIETTKVYLEKSLRESENNLRELVLSKQQGR